MRTLLVSICLLGALTAPLVARNGEPPLELAVILNFKGPHSPVSIQEMEREAVLILNPAGVRLRWGMLGAGPAAPVYNHLAVMTFRGSCEFEQTPAEPGELGPYAITRMADGGMLPFGEVDCGRVVRAARRAMTSLDYGWADKLVGRAMGRVVAHELIHILTGSPRHGTEGITQPSLSGEELVQPVLQLSLLDIFKLRRDLKDPEGHFCRGCGETDLRTSAGVGDQNGQPIDRAHQTN
jgi:hypothetical protein